jgi:hypothetical protein
MIVHVGPGELWLVLEEGRGREMLQKEKSGTKPGKDSMGSCLP